MVLRLLLLLIMLPASLLAEPLTCEDMGCAAPTVKTQLADVCDSIERFEDGGKIGRILLQAERGGLVFVNQASEPDAESVTIWRRRPECRAVSKQCPFVQQILTLSSTGRANPTPDGLREHWRDRSTNLRDLPSRRVFVRAVYNVEGQAVSECYNLRRVNRSRND